MMGNQWLFFLVERSFARMLNKMIKARKKKKRKMRRKTISEVDLFD